MSVALASRIAVTRRASRIIAPYNRLEFQGWFQWMKFGLLALMVLMVIYGTVLVSLGGTELLKIATLPIMVLLGIVIWLLPDVDNYAGAVPKVPNMMPLLLVFLVSIVIWPAYVAVVIPGLPWLTPGRVVLSVILVMLALHYSQHSQSRAKASAILGYDKLAFRLWLLFELSCLVVAPMTKSANEALTVIVLQETMALSAVLVAVLFMDNERNLKAIYLAVTVTCICSMLIAVLENHMQMPPWAEHIPSFMRVDDKWLTTFLSPQARAGDDRYRIRSTFPVVLYFSLYLSITLPLVVFSISKMYKRQPILSVGVIVLIMHTVWFANARSAVIAVLLPLFLFPAFILVRSLRVNERVDVMKYAVRGGIILALVGMLAGLIASSHRAQMMVFGSAQHTGSNDVRKQQWDNAWQQMRATPLGIGIANVQEAVGVDIAGRKIVDSYWINVLVGNGPLGFIGFYGMFLRCAWLGIICFLRAKNDVEEFAGAAAVGLIGFVVEQYVISNSDSVYLVMLFCGMILATKRAQDKRIAEEARLSSQTNGAALVPARA